MREANAGRHLGLSYASIVPNQHVNLAMEIYGKLAREREGMETRERTRTAWEGGRGEERGLLIGGGSLQAPLASRQPARQCEMGQQRGSTPSGLYAVFLTQVRLSGSACRVLGLEGPGATQG